MGLRNPDYLAPQRFSALTSFRVISTKPNRKGEKRWMENGFSALTSFRVISTLFFPVRKVRKGAQADKMAQNHAFSPLPTALMASTASCEHLNLPQKGRHARKSPLMASNADALPLDCPHQADNDDNLALSDPLQAPFLPSWAQNRPDNDPLAVARGRFCPSEGRFTRA
jgi:hypothetical protein